MPMPPARGLVAASLLAAAIAAPAAARAASYVVEPDSSRIVVETGTSGFLSWTGAGHEHVIRATRFAGSVDFDPARVESTRVEITIAAGSLRVTDAIDPDTAAKIQRRMESELLAIDDYAYITFAATGTDSIAPIGAGAWSAHVTGDLTIRDVTRPVVLPVTLRLEGRRLAATGEVEIRQTDFGIEPVSVGLGAIKVADALDVSFAIIAVTGKHP